MRGLVLLGLWRPGDWLTEIGPAMSDTSSGAGLWWKQVIQCSSEAYRNWLHAQPLERIHVEPLIPSTFSQPRFSRLEQRGAMALLKAIPGSLKRELVAQRRTSCPHIIFRFMIAFQPGGARERASILKALGDPDQPLLQPRVLLLSEPGVVFTCEPRSWKCPFRSLV